MDKYNISDRTNWWLDSNDGLSRCAKSMLMFLVLVSNSKTGASWYSRATIAEHTGYSDSQVRRGLLELQRKGLISIQSNTGSSNTYNLNLDYESSTPVITNETPVISDDTPFTHDTPSPFTHDRGGRSFPHQPRSPMTANPESENQYLKQKAETVEDEPSISPEQTSTEEIHLFPNLEKSRKKDEERLAQMEAERKRLKAEWEAKQNERKRENKISRLLQHKQDQTSGYLDSWRYWKDGSVNEGAKASIEKMDRDLEHYEKTGEVDVSDWKIWKK